MVRLTSLFFIISNLVLLSSGSKILCIYYIPSHSHQVVFREFTRNLLERGHELVVATPLPWNKKHPNLTEIDLSRSTKIWKRLSFNTLKYKDPNFGDSITMWNDLINDVIRDDLSTMKIQSSIRDEKFDLLVVEYLVSPALSYLKQIMNVPLIGMASMDLTPFGHSDVGQSFHYYKYPESHTGKELLPNSLMKKIQNLYGLYLGWSMYKHRAIPQHAQIVRDFIDPSFEKFEDYDLTPDVVFVNAHPILGFSRPVMPTFVDISGIHISKPKALPEDIRSYIEDSKEGVIIFSLGGNVRSEQLPKQVIQTFLDAFHMTPFRVLWKWESNESVSQTDDVRTYKWLPQNDIMSHPKVKLLIFQGGYQSLIEAITYGIPTIAIPFVGDQYLNAEKIHYYGIGIRLQLAEINKEVLKDAIMRLTTDYKYKENVVKMSKQLYDSPMSPSEKAVWWTEYVIRHNGTKHLQHRIKSKLSFVEEFYLDVLLVFLGLILSSFLTIVFTWKYFRTFLSLLNMQLQKKFQYMYTNQIKALKNVDKLD